jgi:hypothetical protein
MMQPMNNVQVCFKTKNPNDEEPMLYFDTGNVSCFWILLDMRIWMQSTKRTTVMLVTDANICDLLC